MEKTLRIFGYTITRANTEPRARLLLDTLNRAKATSGCAFDWTVYTNGAQRAEDVCTAAKSSGLIQNHVSYPVNVGQHIPTNEAIHAALEGDYDILLRIDDDVDFETKRWLAKLCEFHKAIDSDAIISPMVNGLKHPPDMSDIFSIEGGYQARLVFGAIGGICRFTPVALLRANPYLADTRQPMGFGDATGVARWATANNIPMLYAKHIQIKHAKSTAKQEVEDKEHFLLHPVLQRVPYIPTWKSNG